MNKELKEFRDQASIESLGSSSDLILNAIVLELEKLQLQNIKRVLDIGCGQGVLLDRLKGLYPNAEFVGIDYSQFKEWDESTIKFIQHDCNQNLPDDLGEFDLIVSSEVIEHLENGRHFVREIVKHSNSGGTILISTPNLESYTSLLSFFFRGYHSAFGGNCYPAHILPVSEFDLKNMISETGKVKYQKTVFIKNGRIPKTNILWKAVFPFVCGKRFSDNYFVVAIKD